MGKEIGVALTLTGALALAGCSGADYVMREYAATKPVMFDVPGEDTYRVYDKPPENKLMITPSIAKAALMGAGRGITFGAADTRVPKPMMESAALAYLQSTGRTCRIVDGSMVLDPQWEFKYDCMPPAPPPVAQRRR